ncbi:MAG: hypothetical protein V5A21_03465 [Halapricum sp.]
MLLGVESFNLANFRDDRHRKDGADAGNRHEQLRLFPGCSNLVDLTSEALDLGIERRNNVEISLNDVPISSRKRKFLVCEELPSLLSEEITIVGNASISESGANTILCGSAVINEGFPPPDEFPRFAELVRWDVTRCECVNP